MQQIYLPFLQIPFRKNRLFLCVFIVLFGLTGITFSISSQGNLQNAANNLAIDTAPANERAKTSCCGGESDTVNESYTLVGSYYSLKDNQETILMFNNKGPAPLVVSPTFFSLSGERLDLPALMIPATSYQEVDLRVLLANYLPQFEEGSLQITHHGKRLQFGAQFKILKQGMLFDEQFITPATRFPSPRMESVWWMPSPQHETKFILSNTTDFPMTTTVEVDGTAPRQRQPAIIQLNPHETRVLDILRDLIGQQHGGTLHKTGGISLTHSGAVGTILARMLISKESTGYSSVVSFTDPTTPVSSKLNGGGLRLGSIGNDELDQIVVARNIRSEPTTVSGRVSYTNESGDVVFVLIPEVNIAAGKIKTIDVGRAVRQANIPPSVTFAGLELEYTTAPGSVIMNAQSVSRSSEQVFQVPLLDPNRMPSSAGGFPWKVDNDYNTIVFIKNETDTPKKYLANLTYEGGAYTLGAREVKARQTVALDFKQLRDEQTPDSMGTLIPLNVERGQISWSMVGEDNRTTSGRSEQVNTQLGISSTYACYNCCPHSVYSDGYPTPLSTEVDVGAQQFYGFQANSVDCYGQGGPPYFTFGYGWLTSDAIIATITGSGAATAMSGGTAFMTGSFDNVIWTDSSHSCSSQVTTVSGTGDIQVRPRVEIAGFDKIPLDSSEISGVTKSILLTANATPSGGTYSWSSNSNKVTLSNTSSRTVTVEAVSASDSMNDVVVSVIYTVNGRIDSASKSLTVVKPTYLRNLSQDTNPTGTNCGTFNSFLTRITYETLDQFNQPILGVIVYADESFDRSGLSGNCRLDLQQGGGLHSSTSVIDTFQYCNDACNEGFSCVISGLKQSLSVNGFSVQITAGQTNYSRNAITYTCSNVIVIPKNN